MTAILSPDPAGLARACALLRAGELVAFGTETVYGLGADATNDRAVAGIFAAKGRPSFNPLIAHYPDAAAAFAHVRTNDIARQLANTFWPGPLTLVLQRAENCPVSLLVSAGGETLAVRVPANASALALLHAVGRPIAAPSANRSGHVSPTSTAHVLAELSGKIAAILDSGPCPVGVESTVLDVRADRPVLLRAGGITVEAVEAVIGPVLHTAPADGPLRSPGLLASHYAPELPLRLAATAVHANEALLAWGPPLGGAGLVYQLSATQDLSEAAARLFAGLRWLDTDGRQRGLARIAAMALPSHGLGRAINDRLRRAAAPRA